MIWKYLLTDSPSDGIFKKTQGGQPSLGYPEGRLIITAVSITGWNMSAEEGKVERATARKIDRLMGREYFGSSSTGAWSGFK